MRRLLGVLLALIVVQALPPFSGTAVAHSRPVRFDPAPGVILTAAPSQLTGWFSSDIRRVPDSFLHVLDATGQRVDMGEVQLSSDRKQMSVALRSGLAPGRYLVNWSANDDGDGHTLAGCYVFFVGETAANAAVSAGDPLDGGSRCPTVVEEDDEPTEDAGAEGAQSEDGDDGGVPVWALALGVVGGIVAGGIGGRALGRS
jgi:methionine-rich copper-binding protein CopC